MATLSSVAKRPAITNAENESNTKKSTTFKFSLKKGLSLLFQDKIPTVFPFRHSDREEEPEEEEEPVFMLTSLLRGKDLLMPLE
jgi:hypothetical protein